MDFYFIKTNGKNKFAVHNNYLFKKHSVLNGTEYYKCKNTSCKSKLMLVNGSFSKVSEHIPHVSHQIEILKQLAINKMKDKVSLNLNYTECSL